MGDKVDSLAIFGTDVELDMAAEESDAVTVTAAFCTSPFMRTDRPVGGGGPDDAGGLISELPI